MSSRETYITLGPANGNYEHKSVPAEDEDIPAFLQDEFLSLGGIVNGILEGGAFPPYTALPRRVREGMMIYFSEPVPPSIGSAGIWLYRDGQWWKLIDDPSTIIGNTTVYFLEEFGNRPPTPPAGVGIPPVGWLTEPPAKPNKGWWIWASQVQDISGRPIVFTWSLPVAWSAGVIDGSAGAPGIPGDDGIRGNVNIVDPVYRASFNTQAAYDLILAEVTGRNPAVPINGDAVTQQEDPLTATDPPFVEHRSYQVGSGNPGIWELIELLVDGNLVVQGTINGEAIRANSQIRIGGNAGQDLVVLDAQDANARIWVGGSNGSNAVFRVDPDGNMFANSGEFRGTSVSNQLSGDIVSQSVQTVVPLDVEHTSSASTTQQISTWTFTPQTDISGQVVDMNVQSMAPPIIQIYVNTNTGTPLPISATIPPLSIDRIVGNASVETFTLSVTMVTTSTTGTVTIDYVGSISGSVNITAVNWTLSGFSHTDVTYKMEGGNFTVNAFKESNLFSPPAIATYESGMIIQLVGGNDKYFSFLRAVTDYDLKSVLQLQSEGLMDANEDYLLGGIVVSEALAKSFDTNDFYLATL